MKPTLLAVSGHRANHSTIYAWQKSGFQWQTEQCALSCALDTRFRYRWTTIWEDQNDTIYDPILYKYAPGRGLNSWPMEPALLAVSGHCANHRSWVQAPSGAEMKLHKGNSPVLMQIYIIYIGQVCVNFRVIAMFVLIIHVYCYVLCGLTVSTCISNNRVSCMESGYWKSGWFKSLAILY